MPPPAATGRPRRFCRDSCRRAASRARKKPVAWSSFGPAARIPPDPLTLRRRTYIATAEYLDGLPAAPPERQLEEILIALPQLVWTLNTICPELTRALAVRCGALAADIDRALQRSFGEIL